MKSFDFHLDTNDYSKNITHSINLPIPNIQCDELGMLGVSLDGGADGAVHSTRGDDAALRVTEVDVPAQVVHRYVARVF